MKASPETEQQVVAVLDQWAAAYRRKDAAQYAATFGDDDDVLLLGTGADEVAVGREHIAALLRRDFEEADDLDVRLGEVRVSAAGDVAWAAMHDAGVEVAADGLNQSFPLRITAVLERRGGGWLIQHAHVSAPLAGQELGYSFPVPQPAG